MVAFRDENPAGTTEGPLGLSTAGHPPKSLHTTATVHLEKQQAGFSVTGIHLALRGEVPGVSKEEFLRMAEETKKNCIISRALAVPMTLDAQLA